MKIIILTKKNMFLNSKHFTVNLEFISNIVTKFDKKAKYYQKYENHIVCQVVFKTNVNTNVAKYLILCEIFPPVP